MRQKAKGKRKGQRRKGRIFGKWQVLCDAKARQAKDKGASCRMAQSVLARDGALRIFLLRIYRGETPVALVTTPMGIFLKPGLSLAVDRNPGRVFSFETCDEQGCHAGIALSEALIEEFRQGRLAVFRFYDGARNQIAVPIVLEGFRPAFEALMQ